MAQFRMACTWNYGDKWYIIDNRVDANYIWKVVSVDPRALTGGMSYKCDLVDVFTGMETRRFVADFSAVYVLTSDDVKAMCEKRKIDLPKFM